MAKISALPVAAPLDGTEHLPIVQGAVTRNAPLANIIAMAEVAARGQIDDQLGSVLPLIRPELADGALKRAVAITLYSSVDGIDLAWPERLTLREIAKRAADGFLRCRIAADDGEENYITLAAESMGALIDATGLSGTVHLPYFCRDASIGVPVGTVVGYVTIRDIEDSFGEYALTVYDHAQAGLAPARIFRGPAEDHAIDERIARREATMIVNTAFELDSAHPYLTDITEEIVLTNGKAHDYIVSLLRTTATHLTYDIFDKVEGRRVAYAEIENPDYANLPDRIPIIAGGRLPGLGDAYSGIEGYVRIRPERIVVSTWVGEFTEFADSGIKRSKVRKPVQVLNDYRYAGYAEVIEAGAGHTFATARSAVESTYDAPIAPDEDQVPPTCRRASADHRIAVDLDVGDDFAMTNLWLPHNVSLIGRHPEGTFVRKEDDRPLPMIQAFGSSDIKGFTIINETDTVQYGSATAIGQYSIHNDPNGRFSIADATGRSNYRQIQNIEHMRFIGGVAQNAAFYGSGLGPGRFRVAHCDFLSLNPNRTNPLIAAHDVEPYTQGQGEGAVLEIESCEDRGGRNSTVASVFLQSFRGNPGDNGVEVCPTVIINNCPSFGRVTFSRENIETGHTGRWVGRGNYRGTLVSNVPGVFLEFGAIKHLRNTSGAAIAANKACIVADGRAAGLAMDGDVVDAIALEPVASNAFGRFVTAPAIDLRMIGVAPATTGYAYLDAGSLTTVPQPSGQRVGRMIGGILHLFWR